MTGLILTRACVARAVCVAAVLAAAVLVLPAMASAQSDLTPPETIITAGPPNPTGQKDASFSFTGTDDITPAFELEFECRLDAHLAPPGTDPLDLWLECLSPQFLSGLAVGQHVFEVQATDEAGNVDPTPATYAWTVLPPQTCPEANGTSEAEADAWIDEHSPIQNKGDDSSLKVQSKAPSENFRALVRFPLPQAPGGCVVQSAKLRLYSDSVPSAPRTLQALRLTSAWGEFNVTWSNQPLTAAPAAQTPAGFGYVEWDVTAQVQAMYAAGNHGFLIRDAQENDLAGDEQSFFSREKLEQPPQLVVCFADCPSGGGGGTPPLPPPPFPGFPFPPPLLPVPGPIAPPPVAALPVAALPQRPVVRPAGPVAALRCRIPNVKRRTLRQARTALGRAGCRVGTIRKQYSRVRKGRVIAQRPGRVGTRAYRGFRVNLVLSKGKKPRRAAR